MNKQMHGSANRSSCQEKNTPGDPQLARPPISISAPYPKCSEESLFTRRGDAPFVPYGLPGGPPAGSGDFVAPPRFFFPRNQVCPRLLSLIDSRLRIGAWPGEISENA